MTEVMETLSALALLVIVMGGMASMGLSLKMKQITGPLRDRWTVKIGNGPDMDVQGNILDHEYEIKEGRRKIAQVSKKWFRVRDTFGVEIAPDQEDVVILAITVALDQMAHPSK